MKRPAPLYLVSFQALLLRANMLQHDFVQKSRVAAAVLYKMNPGKVAGNPGGNNSWNFVE
eukprot:1157740-Pelagomonas_calceolata.AAC.4